MEDVDEEAEADEDRIESEAEDAAASEAKDESPKGRGHRTKKKTADLKSDHVYESDYGDYSFLQSELNQEHSFLQVPFEDLSETQHHHFLKLAIKSVKMSGNTQLLSKYVMGVIFTQMSVKAGLRIHGKRAWAALLKELCQLKDKEFSGPYMHHH